MQAALQAVRDATADTKFEGQIWLVGGAVRDPLLRQPEPCDVDLVTELDSAELAQWLFDSGVSKIAPVVYPRFGTAMVHVQGTEIEIVTARKESYDAKSRKPKVEPATLLDDAKRRDFTVNTLLRNLHSDELRDPLGSGLDDLKSKSLRTPLEPKATFADDPLRMLRAVRFRWQLGFDLASGLYDAIKAEAERLKIISFERVQEEFNKMLLLPEADRCLQDLFELNLLSEFAPELVALVGVEQGEYHHLDAWDHTLMVVKASDPSDLTLRLAALFHDIGKPQTRSVEPDGRTRFFGHESVGAELTRRVMRRLKYANAIIADVETLVKNHMRFSGDPNWTPAGARRLIHKLGPHLDRLFKLVAADRSAHRKGAPTPDVDAIRQLIDRIAKETPPAKLRSPLSGLEIQNLLRIGPGPEVGKWKSWLTEQILEGSLQPGDKEAASIALLAKAKETAEA